MPYNIRPDDEEGRGLIDADQMKKIFDECDTKQKKFLLALVWLVGPRINEVCHKLRRGDIAWDDNNLLIRICTLKRRKRTKKDGTPIPSRDVPPRVLPFKRVMGHDDQMYIETIIQIATAEKDMTKIMWPFSDRWARYTIAKVTKKALGYELYPHAFRHSVATWYGGYMGLAELAAFRGGSPKSCLTYVHPRTMVVDSTQINKSRWLSPLDRPTVLDSDEANAALAKYNFIKDPLPTPVITATKSKPEPQEDIPKPKTRIERTEEKCISDLKRMLKDGRPTEEIISKPKQPFVRIQKPTPELTPIKALELPQISREVTRIAEAVELVKEPEVKPTGPSTFDSDSRLPSSFAQLKANDPVLAAFILKNVRRANGEQVD